MYGPEISLTKGSFASLGGVFNIDIMNEHIKISTSLQGSFFIIGAKLGGAMLIRKKDLDLNFGLQTGVYTGLLAYIYWEKAFFGNKITVEDWGGILKAPLRLSGSLPHM